jgi:hypothetical protein
VLAVAVVAGGAAAAQRTDALIRPGLGIGKVRLGMTDAQVRRALGRPLAQRRSRTGFGRLRVEYQYVDGFLLVRLTGRASSLRVVGVSTIQPHERTANGIGPESASAFFARGSAAACAASGCGERRTIPASRPASLPGRAICPPAAAEPSSSAKCRARPTASP